ncbi:O-linked N-acetylglucosamine transferase family protein [Pseudothauera nasutitermitis]|uniref:O-linked N-acetylglucosamine transferase family protein n=1 Tax=Pseudothauera nasutitermitis TaxID=2565930 RepID=UPI001454C36E|nr:tetratricopeptide repeat protein [Pseudothauera nasutitermitis]
MSEAATHFVSGRPAQAAELARALCARHARFGPAHKLLGSALHLLGEHDEAVRVLRLAVELLPGDGQTWSNLGNALDALGDAEGAIAAHRRAVELLPDAATPRHNLGCALLQQGKRIEALEQFWLAYERSPQDEELARLCRELVLEVGDADLQRRFCRLNLQHLPQDAGALGVLGALLVDGSPEEQKEAEQLLAAALNETPDNAVIWSNLCVLLRSQTRLEEAIKAGRRAVALAPQWAPGFNNLGTALRDAGAWEEAKQQFMQALAHDGECADAWYNLGCVCVDLGEHDDARAAFVEAVTRFQHPAWLLQAAHACRQVADWDAAQLMEGELGRQLSAGNLRAADECRPSPFAFLTTPGTDAAAQLQVARNYADRFAELPALAPASPPVGTDDQERLRVGLLSADFRDHATAHLMTGMLEALDPGRFHLIAYDYGPPAGEGDAYRRRLREAIPDWVPIASMAGLEAAQRMRADGVGIAIDLKGWTQGARTEVLAYRPAPVQMQWLGFPGTMGAPWLDYIIADAVVIPHGAEAGYSEQVLRLPGCYQPNDRHRVIGAMPSRAALGLPEDAVVLAAFHQYYKITRELFALWLRVLARCPQAVLWLLDGPDSAKAVLVREAQAAGIDPARLVWAPRLPVAEHLGRLAQADIALDTFPVNAHTTASDALWAGVPQVALCGETFVSRVSASIVCAAGLPQLVAHDPADYEALVFRLVCDGAQRAALRTQLRETRDRVALFDARAFARHFGAGLEMAWARHRQGLPAAHIDVPAMVSV